uniref:Uncharacterized protein n=1 Tax=Arundo donax TaxID=35708 RepID=A0A0A9FYG0_ARUDO
MEFFDLSESAQSKKYDFCILTANDGLMFCNDFNV